MIGTPVFGRKIELIENESGWNDLSEELRDRRRIGVLRLRFHLR
jgi:hypothetical protein